MKLRVEIDGDVYTLNIEKESSAGVEYALSGAVTQSGQASVVPVMPGVFSVLLTHKSFTVAIARKGAELEVWTGGRRHFVSIADPRDRAGGGKKVSAAGPVEIRAQMPGKVIKVLAQQGAAVTAGQGVIIVEAMKMQNEMKSPKDGSVMRICAAEGSTVAAGEMLLAIE